MRFTLAACLALTAAIAVLCYLLTAKPSVVSYVLTMAVIVFAPVCALGGIIYGRDNLRAFCIGAALPLALLVWASSPQLQAITFDPLAYGWTPQGQTGAQTATAVYDLQTTGGTPITGSTDIMGMSGATFRVVFSPTVTNATAYNTTLERAEALRNPACSLAIAAILCGGLMMAIRGGLKRKEPVAGDNAVG